MSDNSQRPSKRQRIEHECSDPDNKISTDGADEVTITCAYCTCYLEHLEDINEYNSRIEKLAESEKKVAELEKLLKERERQLFDAEFTAAGYKAQVYSLEKEKEKLCYYIKSHLSSFESLGKILKSAMD